MRVQKFLQIHSVLKSSWLTHVYLKNGRTTTDNRHGAFESINLHRQPSSRLPFLLKFCSDLLASETHFLPLEGQEEQTSSVRQDLGEFLLVVGLRDVFACVVIVKGYVHRKYSK